MKSGPVSGARQKHNERFPEVDDWSDLQLSPPSISLEMPKHLVSVLMEPNAVDEGTKVRLESALIPKHAIRCITTYS